MKKIKITENKIYPYIMGVVLVLLLTLLSNMATEIFVPSSLVAIYLLMVVVASVWWKRGPAIMVSILGALALDFFIIPPYLNFTMSDTKYFFTFAGVSAVGLLINALASQARQQAIDARQKEERITLLYRLSRDLAAADSLDEVLEGIRKNVGEIFSCSVIILLVKDAELKVVSCDPSFSGGSHEEDAARWVFNNAKAAGVGTDIFSQAKGYYLPLRTSQRVLGVLGVSLSPDKMPDSKEGDLLNALASQAAVALERVQQAEITRQLALMHDRERLQTALLNSISHDLRTPLVSVKGVLSGLLENSGCLNEEIRREMLMAAYEDADHLNRIVGNLLDITRLEAGVLKLHLKPCEVRDMLGASLHVLKNKIHQRMIVMNVPKDIPEVAVDFVLMMRVFGNLIDNAIKYSPEGTPIDISVSLVRKGIRINIQDKGYGIPEQDLERVFDKFYRISRPSQITGTGLGLSICKGIVEGHGGRIWVENNKDEGVTFSVVLPLERTDV